MVSCSVDTGADTQLPDDITEQDDDDEHTDSCGASTPVRCPDGSCVVAQANCDPIDQPPPLSYEIDGEVLSVSPGSVQGASPEPVDVRLHVGDRHGVQALLDAGSTFTIELQRGSAVQSVPVSEVVAAPEQGGDVSTWDFHWTLRFTPPVSSLAASRWDLRVRLAGDSAGGNEGSVEFGRDSVLRYRGDADAIEFANSESYRLEGVTSPQRIWAVDTNGDGLHERLVLDGEFDDASFAYLRLLVYRCPEDTCAPVGHVELFDSGLADEPSAQSPIYSDEEFIVAPDMFVGPSSNGFLLAYPSARTESGDVSMVTVVHLQVVAHEATHVVQQRAAHIPLASSDGKSLWFPKSFEPVLLEDDITDDVHLGLSALRRFQLDSQTFWGLTVFQADSEPEEHMIAAHFEDLDEAGMAAALSGHVAMCRRPDNLVQASDHLPQGAIVAVFQLGEHDYRLSVGSSSELAETHQVFALPDGISPLLGPQSAISCSIRDLDGDGYADLLVAVGGTDGQHVLLAARSVERDADGADASPDIRAYSRPTVMLRHLESADWHVFCQNDHVHLLVHRTGRNPQTGKEIKIATKSSLTITANEDPTDAVWNISVHKASSGAAGVAVLGLDQGEGLEIFPAVSGMGNDKVLRKRPKLVDFNDGVSSSDVGGGKFLGADMYFQQVNHRGAWVLAHFDRGLEGNGDGALRFAPPKSILGWLGTTGPFIPMSAPQGGDFDENTNLVYGVGHDAAEPHLLSLGLHYDDQHEVDGVRQLTLGFAEGLPSILNDHIIDLDFSSLAAGGKNVVRFKAGADLSTKVSAAVQGGDSSCGGDSCPGVLLAFELDTGDVAVAHVSSDSSSAVTASLTGYRFPTDPAEALGTGIWTGHLGGRAVLVLRQVLDDEDGLHNFVLLQFDSGSLKIYSPQADQMLVGDFRGLGFPQLTTIGSDLAAGSVADDDDWGISTGCGVTEHLISVGGGGGDLDDVEGDLSRVEDLCLPKDTQVVGAFDVDGDRCTDLVLSDDTVLLSRCDGNFDAVPVYVPSWFRHVFPADGFDQAWPAAKTYNSTRSNRTGGMVGPEVDFDDVDDDNDGLPTRFVPMFDGVTRSAQ